MNKKLIGVGVVVLIAAIVGIVLGIVLTRSSDDDDGKQGPRSFTIDYENDSFLMDGKPFHYVAGAFHYFRALPQTWRDKLRTLKAGGLNAVDIYIQWSLHNPEDGLYHWDGIADVERVIQIAHEEELYVILRPGPYICSELDNGGLPYWLARKYPNIKVRTQDPDYLFEVGKWYEKLMPQFEKHWYGNGGSIIMVQIENEYGAFGACDEVYKDFLRDHTKKYTQDNAVLFTVDRPIDDELTCGQVKNVFVTTDFGLANKSMVDYNFAKLREVQPKGPLVNTEFYTGWLTHWQEPNARRNAQGLAETLDYMLALNANVDFYMYFGGTNFGFWAGANDWGIGSYMADITSYDYDAPMDEAGNPTEKYMIFRDVIMKYLPEPDIPVPEKAKTMQLPAQTMRPINTILSDEGRRILGTNPLKTNTLVTFKDMRQFSGFLLYETTLPEFSRDPANLVISDLRDRALVYIDHEFVGALSRENVIDRFPISMSYGSKLSILVENQGRINFQIADDYKGIRDRVRISTFDSDRETFITLTDWTITGFPFENFNDLELLLRSTNETYEGDAAGYAVEGPIVFHTELVIEESQDIHDTYWDTSDWEKGFIFINGFNLGRYWSIGPQMAIYIPKDILKHGKNDVFIVELQKAPSNMRMNFVNGPIFINDEKV